MGLNEKFFKTSAVDDTPNFGVAIWDGDSSVQAISLGFAPDMVWVKKRNSATSGDHMIMDTVRGIGSQGGAEILYPSYAFAQSTNADTSMLRSFDSTGFTVGSYTYFNSTGNKYVGWGWKSGGAAIQNNDGSITGANCLVSANQNAGFSITKYTGNGTSGATFGHGLGKQVEISIVKNVGSSGYWYVYSNLLPTNNNLYLNTADSKQADGVMLGGNSTTVSISASSAVNTNSGSYIAYNFASIAGYQKIGTYTGTETTNPVYTTDNGASGGANGFEPKFVMVKSVGTTQDWYMWDNERSTSVGSNPSSSAKPYLRPNSSGAENSQDSANIGFNSNGFSLIGGSKAHNEEFVTYIYLAIA